MAIPTAIPLICWNSHQNLIFVLVFFQCNFICNKYEWNKFLTKISTTLPVKMFGLGQKVLSHLAWSKFWPILANQETLAILHENEAKSFFFRKKNFKMADWKKAYFPKSPILKIFSRKFHGLVVGSVGLNDAKPIDMAQPIWPWGCPT